MDKKALLSLFPYAPEEFKRDLVSHSMPVELQKGSLIGYPGARCQEVPIVLEGSVKVYFAAENGREIFLYRIGPGETCMFTNLSILRRMSYPAYAVCEEKVLGFVIPSDVALSLFEKYSVWRNYVLEMITKNIMGLFLALNELVSKKVDQRLYEYLNARVGKVLKLTHEDIARDIGTAREVVSRLLKELEREGYVELGRGEIRVLRRIEVFGRKTTPT